MQELLKQYEERQEKYDRLAEENRLHVSWHFFSHIPFREIAWRWGGGTQLSGITLAWQVEKPSSI